MGKKIKISKAVTKSNNKGLTVVGIGASAGGLDAIQQLFDDVPNNTGMAFIIVQHLSPDYKSLMPELLAKHTGMKIFTAKDKQEIRPDCIYLNQRSKNLYIKKNKLMLLEKGPRHKLNLPIDLFFHSLGEECKENAVGVILSGTGLDGSRGLKTIKENGGTIMVQEPESAQFTGMPNSSISANQIDYILNPKEMAKVLAKFPDKHKLEFDKTNENNPPDDAMFLRILNEVYRNSGIDFTLYKRSTLIRRLEKRMNIANKEKLSDYYNHIKDNRDELKNLKQDFLIGVTSFFRDIEAFNSLKNNVIPHITKKKDANEVIRIWVAGSSTGEEVYSIAMLLDSYLKSNNIQLEYKIFATDIDEKAVQFAGNGCYHINVANEIEEPYLQRYFTKKGDQVQIIKRIREKIVFSQHNIIKDPPLIRMDLISCRNLLIYLDNKAQKKVLLNFQFALNKNCFLFLGNSESLGRVSDFFEVVDNKWKIYKNISETKQIPSQIHPDDRISTLNLINPDTASNIPLFKYKEDPENFYYKILCKG